MSHCKTKDLMQMERRRDSASVAAFGATSRRAVRGVSRMVQCRGSAGATGPYLALSSMKPVDRRTAGFWSRDAIFDAMYFTGARRLVGTIAGAAQAAVRSLLARDSGLEAHQAQAVAAATAGRQALRASRAVSAGVVRACLESFHPVVETPAPQRQSRIQHRRRRGDRMFGRRQYARNQDRISS